MPNYSEVDPTTGIYFFGLMCVGVVAVTVTAYISNEQAIECDPCVCNPIHGTNQTVYELATPPSPVATHNSITNYLMMLGMLMIGLGSSPFLFSKSMPNPYRLFFGKKHDLPNKAEYYQVEETLNSINAIGM